MMARFLFQERWPASTIKHRKGHMGRPWNTCRGTWAETKSTWGGTWATFGLTVFLREKPQPFHSCEWSKPRDAAGLPSPGAPEKQRKVVRQKS